MSHNLSIVDGVVEAAYGSATPAWHGLGKVVSGLMTADEVLENAHLSWDVELTPLLTNTGIDIPANFAVVRSDRQNSDGVLGVVGDKYTPLQNRDAFGFFDGLIDRGEAVYDAAGALDNGKKVWMLAKLPETLTVGGNDPVQPYILLANSHDGNSSFVAKLVNIRVVCANTLSAALRAGGDCVKVRHCASIEEKMREAARVLGLARKQAAAEIEAFRYMAGVQFDSTMLAYFLCSVLPASGKGKGKITAMRETVQGLFEGKAQGADIAGKTAWGAYNAVTEYVDHVKNYRGDKLQSVWFGRGADLSRKAFKVASTIETVDADTMNKVIAEQSA